MFDSIFARLKQGHHTVPDPLTGMTLSDRYRGLPVLDSTKCPAGCGECVKACPTQAISQKGKELRLDMGKCLFCTECFDACPSGAVSFSGDFSLSSRTREGLVIDKGLLNPRVEALEKQMMRLFGRSLKLRQVSAGGCNACEHDVAVLNNIVFDLSRFGVQFVASPRHADGLLITGPVTQNMKEALKLTYEAVASPKLVIAVGACAISGGPFMGNPEVHNGADSVLPVDLYIPGCPPHPLTILDGLLQLLGKTDSKKKDR